jgi:fructose-bisphosphate aldolase class I
MTAMDGTQLEKIRFARGFFAALDQSGGSTPKALADFGIGASRYKSPEEMFDLVHAMRTRVITPSPCCETGCRPTSTRCRPTR